MASEPRHDALTRLLRLSLVKATGRPLFRRGSESLVTTNPVPVGRGRMSVHGRGGREESPSSNGQDAR